MLLDAMQDVALQEVHLDHVLGGMMVDPATISLWVDHDDRQRFGQYLLRLEGITFDYCGSYRSTTVDGVLDSLSSAPRGESCNNLRDDDGNGFIDCADPTCLSTDLCQQSL